MSGDGDLADFGDDTVGGRSREWVRSGTEYLRRQIDGLTDEQFGNSSELPGWSRAHVVAHLARNADALGNLLAWARTGIETPMYASREQRGADIETSARQSPDDLRADLENAIGRFDAAMAAMPAEAWRAEIRDNAGVAREGAFAVWKRTNEVWIHSVDLGSGGAFADLPADLAIAMITKIVDTLTGKEDCPAAVLSATDAEGVSFRLGAGADAVAVSGTVADLLGWVAGRTGGTGLTSSDGEIPRLPAWL